METNVSEKFFKIFWLLLISLLMFGYSFDVNAQNSSATNLEDTTWKGIADFNLTSGDILKIEFTYLFSKNGKVELAFLTFTSGLELQQTNNNTIQPVFNPMKSTFAGIDICTYKLTGKSIQIKCPTTGDANATINDNRMSGEISSKMNGVDSKKEKWIVERVANESNSNGVASNSGTIKRPTEPRTAQSKTASSKKLKLGTYKITAKEGMFDESIIFKIKIESVEVTGEVKARLYRDSGEWQLKGQVDETGRLQLEGFYVGVNTGFGKTEWKFKLNSTVEDDALVKGTYQIITAGSEWSGTFNTSILEEF